MCRNRCRLRSSDRNMFQGERFTDKDNFLLFECNARHRRVARMPKLSSMFPARSAIIPAMAFSPSVVDTFPYSVKINLNERFR